MASEGQAAARTIQTWEVYALTRGHRVFWTWIAVEGLVWVCDPTYCGQGLHLCSWLWLSLKADWMPSVWAVTWRHVVVWGPHHHWCLSGQSAMPTRAMMTSGSGCSQGPCMRSWSYCLLSLCWCLWPTLPSKATRRPKDLSCHLWPCWCQESVLLSGPQKPEWHQLPPRAMACYKPGL